jgi:hypothetical protein
MSSFESRYILNNPSLWQRIKRDIALLIDSLIFLVIWMTKGRKIRQALRQAEKDNNKLVLEDYFGE